MRILFVHRDGPGQFAHLARLFAAEPGNEVVVVCANPAEPIPGLRTITIAPTRASAPPTHHYVQSFENAVLLGQAAYRALAALRRDGFVPDIAYAHAGFGPGLYVKEAYPQTPLIGYFEWYYRPRGSDADFLSPAAVTEDEALRIRTKNAAILLELAQCDRGICPTRFQRDQFPAEFQGKLTVLHDGVDSAFFSPAPPGVKPATGLDLDPAAELITYAARGLEPYRGFVSFMRALAILQRRRDRLHAIVLGDDNVYYGRPRDDGKTWREAVLAELPGLDLGRIHFLGRVVSGRYREVLRASLVHVYLTVPFVLSWSLIEAMATGCAIVGSDTAPVRDVLRDGATGLVAGFDDPDGIAARIGDLLDRPDRRQTLGAAARRHAVEKFSLETILPRHREFARTLLEPRVHGEPRRAGHFAR